MEKDTIANPNRLLVIGGSSGSLDALLKFLATLPPGFPIPIVVVMHRNPTGTDMLSEVLMVKTKLLVKEADEKEPILGGTIYLAPANYHLLVEYDYTFSLDASEKVNYSRPSIDVTFQSAADVYKTGLACILLSGANSDGSDGLAYAKQLGATIIIQDPEDAIVPYMPQHALAQVAADAVLKSVDMATFLQEKF